MTSPTEQVQTLRKEVAAMKAAIRAELDELRATVSELQSQGSSRPGAQAQGRNQPAIVQPAVQVNNEVDQPRDAGEKLDKDPSSSSDPVLKKRVQKAAHKEETLQEMRARVERREQYEVLAFMQKFSKK